MKEPCEWYLIDTQAVVIHGIGVRLAVEKKFTLVQSGQSDCIDVIERSAYERLRQALTEIREKTSPEYAVHKIADEALGNSK